MALWGRSAHCEFPSLENVNNLFDNFPVNLALLAAVGISLFAARWLLGLGSDEDSSQSGMDKLGPIECDPEKGKQIADLRDKVEQLTRKLEVVETCKKEQDGEIYQLRKEIEKLKHDDAICEVPVGDLKDGSSSANTLSLGKMAPNSTGEYNLHAMGAKKGELWKRKKDRKSSQLGHQENPDYDRPVSDYDGGQNVPSPFQGNEPRFLATQTNLEKAERPNEKVKVRTFAVIRHARRLDQEEQGTTVPGILKHYESYVQGILPRRGSFQDYLQDTPITISGIQEAIEVGKNMARSGYHPVIYSSPAFRCVQTADAIAWGAGIKDFQPIHVEPGLFELCYSVPPLMTVEELARNGYYNIASSYEPYMDLNSLQAQESLGQFHCRQGLVMAHILRHASQMKAGKHPKVLIVAHLTNVGSVSHVLMRQPFSLRDAEQMYTGYLFHEVVTKTRHQWNRKLLEFCDKGERDRLLYQIDQYLKQPYSYLGWRFLADDEWEYT